MKRPKIAIVSSFLIIPRCRFISNRSNRFQITSLKSYVVFFLSSLKNFLYVFCIFCISNQISKFWYNSAINAATSPADDAADQDQVISGAFYKATVDPEIIYEQVQEDTASNMLYNVKVKRRWHRTGWSTEMPRQPDGSDDGLIDHWNTLPVLRGSNKYKRGSFGLY